MALLHGVMGWPVVYVTVVFPDHTHLLSKLDNFRSVVFPHCLFYRFQQYCRVASYTVSSTANLPIPCCHAANFSDLLSLS